MENEISLRWAFDQLNEDKDGFLSPSDLMGALRSRGHTPYRDYVSKIFSRYNLSETGKLSFKEFSNLCKSPIKDTPQQIQRAFQDIDLCGKKRLSKMDIKMFALDYGESLSNEEIDFFFSNYTENQGYLTEEDFIKFNTAEQ